MIITITEVSQEFAKNGAEYRKVRGTTVDGKETTKSVFDNLNSSWPLLVEGAVLEFTMEKKGQYWNVTAISPTNGQASSKVSQRAEKPKGNYAESDTKTRSVAMSYAKDLAVAKVIGVADMERWAKYFVDYIEGVEHEDKQATLPDKTESATETTQDEAVPQNSGELMKWFKKECEQAGQGFSTNRVITVLAKAKMSPEKITNFKLAQDFLMQDIKEKENK